MHQYSVEELNENISAMGYVYRVVREIRHTYRSAVWVGAAGLFHLADCSAGVWVDSTLARYIILSNGQRFLCSNTDLTTMPETEKINIRAILSGLIID